MESLGPLIVLIIVSFVISLAGKAGQAAKKKAAPPKRPAPAPDEGETPSASAAEGAVRPEERALRPTIEVTAHDDSIYAGSLNAVTGEGFDPCHEEQMAPLSLAESVPAETEAPAPSPILPAWSGSEIARGFVMAEILTRRENARR